MEYTNTASSFIKAALFTQVLKTSVALSIIKDCPANWNVEDFVNQLQNSHEFYEIYKDKSYYQANRLKTSLPPSFGEFTQIINSDEVEKFEILKGILSQVSTSVASTRIGFRGLLDALDSITESIVVPGITHVFQSLVWANVCGEILEENGLLHQVAQLHREANDTMKLAGEVSAKLDINEQSTAEIGKFIATIFDLICNVKRDDIYFCWLRPLKTLLSAYIRSFQKNEDLRFPNLVNFLCRHLLICCRKILTDAGDEIDFVNESFPRLYSIACPLLDCYKRKLEMGKDLVETIRETVDTIQHLDFTKGGELSLSSGSIGLLNTLKFKFQSLLDLPS
ncbi:hypothetical protein ACTXT7_012698 [Hymenolepis weldensis]